MIRVRYLYFFVSFFVLINYESYLDVNIGTEIVVYELCIGPHDSCTRNTNSFPLPEYCKIQEVENWWFLAPVTRVGPLDLTLLNGLLRRLTSSSKNSKNLS